MFKRYCLLFLLLSSLLTAACSYDANNNLRKAIPQLGGVVLDGDKQTFLAQYFPSDIKPHARANIPEEVIAFSLEQYADLSRKQQSFARIVTAVKRGLVVEGQAELKYHSDSGDEKNAGFFYDPKSKHFVMTVGGETPLSRTSHAVDMSKYFKQGDEYVPENVDQTRLELESKVLRSRADSVQGQLLELKLRLELGFLSPNVYDKRKAAILDKI